MAITSVTSIAVNHDEYSRFEQDRAVIEAVVFVSGTVSATASENTLTFEIRKARRNRDVVVYTLDVNAATYFGLGAAANFDANAPLYVNLDTRLAVSSPSLISLIRRGEYFVKVYRSDDTSPFTAATTKDSSDFWINPVTVHRMKKDWCFGIDFQSSDLRNWRFDPRQITGVSIQEVSRNHKLSFFPLNYTVDPAGNKFLSWSDGSLIPISTAYSEYMLPSGGPSSEYIVVKVDHNRLPTSTKQEELFIEEMTLSDTTIRRYLSDSIDHIENTLVQVYIEPTSIVTDVDPSELTYSGSGGALVINSDYDFIKSPISFFPRRPGQWIDIQFPFPSLLSVDQLYGAVANTRVVHINPEWIEVSEKSGYTQLVPFNTELAFDFIGLIWVEALRSATPIPNFWHYNLIAGLRDCPGDILELIGKHAAIPILTAAGAAFRGGYSSQSISRDGVSESVSYTSSAIYGIYSASIEDYRNWIREHLPAIKNRYRGPQMIVM
tara:strand:+ start:1071 stop:2549 length:1479 start_codon:yes stop_codon:yes gene_type:complete